MIQNINDNASNDEQLSHAKHPSNSLDWLTRLIAFDTVSRHSNLALIHDVKAYCLHLGI